MNPPRHILICGDVGAGKSTLIKSLLRVNRRPVYGFITKRLSADENGVHTVCIHPAAGAERQCTTENIIGTCDAHHSTRNPEVFDTVGVKLLEAWPDGILLMDELGFMESEALVFCDKVLRALDGDIPILAAVKSRETPFLNAVKVHPNASVYWITRSNRDALYAQLLPVVVEWNA